MSPESLTPTSDLLDHFEISGSYVDCEPLERGHIHDTFISRWITEDGEGRFLHQRMNDNVFQNIEALMHNIELITAHLQRQSQPGNESLQTLDLVKARDGQTYLTTDTGHWRTYAFIENTETYDLCRDEDQAFEAARAFGHFQSELIGIDPRSLQETIPDFFSTPHRFQQFEQSLQDDRAGRSISARPEIEFALQRRSMVDVIERLMKQGTIPSRVVHGDTKLNNVLFDRTDGKARCVVDLDTCMPGYSLYDFGDLVRFTAATSSEDETDLEQAGTDVGLYRALVNGYLEHARNFLNDTEIDLMPFSARLVTLTIGLRFLADYLAGDRYFKTLHPHHNLDRARVQFKMVERMEQREADMAVKRA